MTEQVRQAKLLGKAMLDAVKWYCADFVFGGKFADPSPQLLEETKHMKPSNDDEEHDLGYLGFQLQKSPTQTTERTDAKLKNKVNNPSQILKQMSEKEREETWLRAGDELPKRVKTEKQRRQAHEEKETEIMKEKVKKRERQAKKQKAHHEEFKAVIVARTVDDLDSGLRGLGPKLGLAFIRAQIKQLKANGVSRLLLPLTAKGKPLLFDALYDNVRRLLELGDPFAPETAQLLREFGRKRRKGRPLSASAHGRAVKKAKTGDGDADWKPR